MDLFTESWQDSQFWYKDETATVLAEQLLNGVTEDSKIAVVSAPSVYIQLRNLLVSLICVLLACKREGKTEDERYANGSCRMTVRGTRYDRNSCFLSLTRGLRFSRTTLPFTTTSSLSSWIVRIF